MSEYLNAVRAAAGFGLVLVTAIATLVVPVVLVVFVAAAGTISAWWLLLTVPLAVVCFVLLGGLVAYLVDRW